MSRSLSFIASLLLPVALSTTAFAQSPAGTWDVNVNAGGGNNTAVLTLTEQAGTLTGTFGEDGQSGIALQDVQFADSTLTFSFRNPEHGSMSARVTVDEDTFRGSLSTAYGSFPMTGARQEATTSGLSTRSLLKDLMANEQTRAILDKHAPGLTSHPQIGDAANMTLIEVSEYAGDTLNAEVLKAIDEDLAEL